MTAQGERSQRVPPFALASAAAVPLAYLPPEVPRLPHLLAAAVLMLMVALAVALPDWNELPLGLRTVPAVAYLVGVALLRHADGGTGLRVQPAGPGPLFWVALYGTRGDLVAIIVCIAAIFVVPAVMIGPPL